MKGYLRLGLSIFLISILFIGIFSLRPLFLYNTEEVTAEVKNSTVDISPDNQQNSSKSDEKLEGEMLEEASKENVEKNEIVEVIVEENTKNEVGNNAVEKIEDEDIVESQENLKVAYLTFDDGPSLKVTPAILDILKEYNIKATFFVVGSQAEKHPELLLRIVEEGHLISNHSYSHNYKYIYSSIENFLSDIKMTEDILKGVLGDNFDPTIIRFPGGSFGKNKAKARNAAVQHGYKYIDWNVLNGDAEGVSIPVSKQLARIKETLRNQKSAVVLMHDNDAKQTTVEALPKIIEYIGSQGYVFKTLEDYEFSH